MKVYGCMKFRDGRQVRCVAAVSSQKEFAELMDCSLHYIRGYGAETGNPLEVAVSQASPHTLFWESSTDTGTAYLPWTKET